jgi:hypothetical protein
MLAPHVKVPDPAGIASVVLEYSRDRPPPESPLMDEPATAG